MDIKVSYEVRRAVSEDRESIAELMIESALGNGDREPYKKQALELIDKCIDLKNTEYDSRVFGEIGNVLGARLFKVTNLFNYVRMG